MPNISLPQSEIIKFKHWTESQSKENQDRCRMLIYKTATDIVRRAKMFSPVDMGFLRASIGMGYVHGKMGAEIWAGGQGKGVNVRYAPYVEFGTGTKVVVPTDLKDYAIQFKGKGKRKINQRAQPYFFPAYRISVNEMWERFEQMGFKKT